MRNALNVFGNAIGEAWENFGALTKIWLTTMLVFIAVQIICYTPIYMNMFKSVSTYGTYEPSAGYWILFLVFGFVGILIISGLLVNSWRYLVNKDFKPSWVPFQFDWKTSLGVAGYYLLMYVIFCGIVILIIVAFVISTAGLGQGFAAMEYGQMPSLGQRFFMALGYFGILGSIAAVFWGLVFTFRMSMIMITRALNIDIGLGAVLDKTKPFRKTFWGVVFIYMFAIFGMIFTLYALIILGFTLPLAILFFLPPLWGLIIAYICTFIVYFAIILFVYFFYATIYAELYRKTLAGVTNDPADSKAETKLDTKADTSGENAPA